MTVITITFAVTVVMIVDIFDVAFGYWSMMIWLLLILSVALAFIINIYHYSQITTIYVHTTHQVI